MPASRAPSSSATPPRRRAGFRRSLCGPQDDPYATNAAAQPRSADPASDDAPLPPTRRGEEIPSDEVYGVEPLPGDPGYEEGGRMRAPEAIVPPRRLPTRVVRREQLPEGEVLEGQLPPGAVLEGPVGDGRAGNRSLFRDFFGG